MPIDSRSAQYRMVPDVANKVLLINCPNRRSWACHNIAHLNWPSVV